MFLSLCLMVIPIKGVFILFILMRSCSYNSCGHWNTEKHLRQTWQTKCRGGVPLIMPPWRIQTEIKAEQKQAWKYSYTCTQPISLAFIQPTCACNLSKVLSTLGCRWCLSTAYCYK